MTRSRDVRQPLRRAKLSATFLTIILVEPPSGMNDRNGAPASGRRLSIPVMLLKKAASAATGPTH
jgi:hypothetical protein